jgi:hypothetical protein
LCTVPARILPVLSLRRRGHVLRAWSAACASGEEAYTLSILLREAQGGSPFRVLATDIARLTGIAAALLLGRAVVNPLRETTTVLASSAAQILAATRQQAQGASQTMAAVADTAQRTLTARYPGR